MLSANKVEDATQNESFSYDALGKRLTYNGIASTYDNSGQRIQDDGQFTYYLKDHLNTVNEIVNSVGDIVQKMEYSAFGVLRSVKDSSGVEVGFENAPVRSSFTYTGREFEPELNMYYYRARYYDPNTGRFLQVDPEPGKLTSPMTFLSKYIYTANNPINFTDSTGRNFLNDLGNFFGDLVGWAGLLVAGIVEFIGGVVTLDIAKILTGLAMVVEFALGPINLIFNKRLPKLTSFKGSWVVENSLLSQGLGPFKGFGNFSLGAGMFLNHDPDMANLERTKQHEYGHYLQYKEWGGWDFRKTKSFPIKW